MLPRLQLRFGALAVLVWLTGSLGAGLRAAPGTGLTETLDAAAGRLEWRFKGRTLLVYAWATNQFKPYVQELATLAGDNVMRDGPSDHPHHHGLMFAFQINGVNFWEETGQPGRQRHVTMLGHEAGSGADGHPRARFTELIHWLPAGSGPMQSTEQDAFLVERRTLKLAVDEARQEVALSWHAEFAVGGRTNRIQVHGTDYNGLGLRLPANWDHVARHENSEAAPYVTQGRRDVVPANWGSVSHAWEGRAAQVVLGARPTGQAGTNLFFSMTQPFTYLAATQGLDRTPLEYRSGDRFTLDYLVLAYPVAHPPAEVTARHQRWLRSLQ